MRAAGLRVGGFFRGACAIVTPRALLSEEETRRTGGDPSVAPRKPLLTFKRKLIPVTLTVNAQTTDVAQ